MRARGIAGSLIVAVATCTSLAQNLSELPTRVRGIDMAVCPPGSPIPATWPVRGEIHQTPLAQGQPLAVVPVGVHLGPFIDMDNRRRDEDEAKRRQQEQQLQDQIRREQQQLRDLSHLYGYAYPPAPYPPGGYFYSPATGRYYPYRSNAFYYNPSTGQYLYQPYNNQPPGFYDPSNRLRYLNHGYSSRPNEERRGQGERAEQKHR